MKWPRTLVALAVLGLMTMPAPAAEDKRADTRNALASVVKRLNALDVWFSDAEKQRVRWLKDVLAKDEEVAAISEAVEQARVALATVIASLDGLEAEGRRLQAQRNAQAGKIGEHLAAEYRLNGQDFVKLLLNQESPDTFDRIMRYHRYFSEARLTTLREYQVTLDELAKNKAALEAQAQQAQARQTELAARQAALVNQRDQRKALIAELDEEAESKSSERDRLAADRQRLEQLLAELMRRASELDGSQFLARKGSLPWPVKGPIRSTFGTPRADGRLVWHGMVVAADEGTPVTAVYRGRVIFADWLRGFGLLTIIDHGSGFMTLYGHADSLTKTVGELVESGEVVARAGRSGGQTSSGLYFEVRQKGTARDPLGWLAKR